jgi:hypothetical protein
VTVLITNHSQFGIAYNACRQLRLQVLVEAGWRDVSEASERNCTDDLQGVAPESTRPAAMPIPQTVPPGSYRLRFDYLLVVNQYPPNDGLVPAQQLYTNVFAVR